MAFALARRGLDLLRERRAFHRDRLALRDSFEHQHWDEHSEQVLSKMTWPDAPVGVRQGALWAVTMVRDEADVIERTVRHLIGQGVEAILVADNGSTDETPRILQRLAGEFPLFVVHDAETAYYQAVKMSLLADWARRNGAGWIIPFDADELWFAPQGLLAEWLAHVDADVVEARIHNLFPRGDTGGWALDVTMHQYPKVAFRAFDGARLSTGNHHVLRPGRRKSGLRIVHVPWRSHKQFSNKLRHGAAALALTDLGDDIGYHWRVAGELADEPLRELWDALLAGQPVPSIGWSPTGRTVVANVDSWRTWDPARLLSPGPTESPGEHLTVIYARPPGHGWDHTTLMARQCATLLGGHYVELDGSRPYSRLEAAKALLPRCARGGACLVIAAQPADLMRVQHGIARVLGFERAVGWVMDSFWADRIPRIARHRGYFDQLFVMDGDLVDEWASATGTATDWLPWGTEVLNLPGVRAARPVDLQRLGRQPATWEDDEKTADDARKLGLRFEGRPSFSGNLIEGQHTLDRAMGRAKFVLAFSNLHSPAEYTHPTREYLTGRWTQALAGGATVAGIAPRCRATRELLWDGALLELGTVNRAAGLAQVSEAVSSWRPLTAAHNRLMSLRRLDWRHRYADLADALGVAAPALVWEQEQLRRVEQQLAADIAAGVFGQG